MRLEWIVRVNGRVAERFTEEFLAHRCAEKIETSRPDAIVTVKSKMVD